MELKFHFITFLVLSAAFGTIETRRFFGGKSSSRGSSSSHRGSSSSHRGTSSSYKPSYKPTSTGSFLHSERGHSSSSGSRSDPFKHASAPPLSHGSTNHQSPFRPFATVPPAPHRGSTNHQSPFRPFATVPPAPHRGTTHTQPPFRPFATVPPPPHHGSLKPVTPPPYGFVVPGGSGSPSRPTATIPPIIHTNNRPVTNSHPRPGLNNGYRNTSSSYQPPQPGFNIPRYSTTRPPTSGYHNSSRGGMVNSGYYPTARPPMNGYYNNSRSGGYNPVAPPKVYPTQGYHPGGSTYPRQPSYNPAYPGYHQAGPVYIQPNPSHIYHQNSLPPNPSHTVVIVPGQSNYGSYGRSTGDIFKEALIYAGVNAAVHRITSPNHYDYHNHNSWNSYGTPPQGSSVSSTNTHIVNNNYYGQQSSLPPNNGGGSNLPPYNPMQNYPTSGIQDSSLPSGVTNANINNGNPGSQGSSSFSANPVNPQQPSNGQSYPVQNSGEKQSNTEYNWPGGISDQELWNITEKLFAMDETVYKFIAINLQNQTAKNNTNVTDASPQPLFSIHPDAYQIPTVQAIRKLYEVNIAIENKTHESSRKEEALLVDLMLNTNVMTAAMQFLAQKNLIKKDYFEHKDFLRRIWFTPYDGSSSGFKRVFQGEVVAGEILYGIQDWIAFNFHEESKRANYLSYTEKIELGRNASIVKINFEMSGIKKLGTGILVGTSPELEMALYTICHYARPNNYCVVSLGGKQINIYTHAFRYFGHDLIDLAFPLV